MYRYLTFPILFTVIFIGSCKGKDKQVSHDADVYAVPDTILSWIINADSKTLTRDKNVPDSIVSIQRIINGLNVKYPSVQLVFVKQNSDTAFVTVPDAEYLGEQMGDAGAAEWFADAVINLTSVAGVHFISFQMDLHSHASGGVISRDNYNKWTRL